jgi:sulfur relay (sulfurtransferase) complex TusBCD TusD component (DsrE family)
MKLGLIIYSNDSETVWNALRLGLFSLMQKDEVKIFLTGKGVNIAQLDTNDFNISEQLQQIADSGGQILACGSCVKLHQQAEVAVCPLSTLQELYTIIKEMDKVLTF